MTDWFPTDLGHTGAGIVVSIQASIAQDIVKHCALVTGFPDGEDTVGRAKVGLMPATDVAIRANDIAAALVTDWETRGWIRPTKLTQEEDWTLSGRLNRLRAKEEFKHVTDELDKLTGRTNK